MVLPATATLVIAPATPAPMALTLAVPLARLMLLWSMEVVYVRREQIQRTVLRARQVALWGKAVLLATTATMYGICYVRHVQMSALNVTEAQTLTAKAASPTLTSQAAHVTVTQVTSPTHLSLIAPNAMLNALLAMEGRMPRVKAAKAMLACQGLLVCVMRGIMEMRRIASLVMLRAKLVQLD